MLLLFFGWKLPVHFYGQNLGGGDVKVIEFILKQKLFSNLI